jgi:replicative DNA helicase
MANLSANLQELVVGVLTYHDQGRMIVDAVPLACYDGFFRRYVEKMYHYWSAYGVPPRDHALDLCDELIQEHPADAEVYRRIHYSVASENERGINSQFVLDRVSSFARQQRLKSAIIDAVPLIQNANLEGAEELILGALRQVNPIFSAGTDLGDPRTIIESLNQQTQDTFPTGVERLDELRLGPARKELHLFIGLPKRGKTWWMVNLGRFGMMHHARVLHVTLEMSEAKMAQRYYQALFSITKRKAKELTRTKFIYEDGRFHGFEIEDMGDRPSFEDAGIERHLSQRIKRYEHNRLGIIIKQFPTGNLTVGGLRSFLDQLEAIRRFTPDLLLLDYADLMSVNAMHKRESLGQIYAELRGLAVERNIAIATASQGTRAGAKAKVLRETDVAEDWSKIATADVILTYNQSDVERELKLCRLHVAAARNDEDRFTLMLSQNYGVGRFVFQSHAVVSGYEQRLQELREALTGEHKRPKKKKPKIRS